MPPSDSPLGVNRTVRAPRMKVARFTPSTAPPCGERYTLGTMSVVLLDYGIQVHDLVVRARSAGVYVRTRKCPVVDRGRLVLDGARQSATLPVLSFTDAPALEAFSRAAVEALRKRHPEVVQDRSAIAGTETGTGTG